MTDYLFDKQGEPDGEIERLEQLLSPLAYRGAAPRLPAPRPRRRAWIVGVAVAAAAAALVALLIGKPWKPSAASWAATVRDGVATSDGQALRGETRLPVGAWLESGDARVRLVVADIGTVELAPRTRARIVASTATRQELQLARGTLVAAIDAPPRRFVVTTPRAVVTDLGCGFELTVDEAGRGRLAVTAGQVAVAGADGREVIVHAGARVELTERGPGAPYSPAAEPAPSPPSAPTPPTAPTTPHAPAPTRHHTGTHAPNRATSAHHSAATAPAAAGKQQPHAPPAHKNQPDTIHHDSLKELERSVE